jgi:hypothetical protein
MSIYVISNDLNIENNLFKLGRTKDTNSDIVSKYQRYLTGARLLLWYPSTLTDYVDDERELLRLFDANRNRTPNGFKNEWLSISFEELKTRLDEYFGQNGEDFEDEQKRERERKDNICSFCDKNLSSKCYLNKHMQTCKKRESIESRNVLESQLQQQQQQYESQLQQQQQQYESQLQQQQQQYESQLERLQKQLDEQKELVKMYQNQILEIAKQRHMI